MQARLVARLVARGLVWWLVLEKALKYLSCMSALSCVCSFELSDQLELSEQLELELSQTELLGSWHWQW